MITLRIATAVATTLVGGSALFTECPPPVDETCSNTAPEEGCLCEVEGDKGCTADGEYHSEAFVCVNGEWTDLQGTDQANEIFCGSGFYGGCYASADGNIEVACAVPGFIGIARARQARRAAAARRLRAA